MSTKRNRGNEDKPQKSVPDNTQSPDVNRSNPDPFNKGNADGNKPEQKRISNEIQGNENKTRDIQSERNSSRDNEEPVRDNSIRP
jgi:hypothetical protein